MYTVVISRSTSTSLHCPAPPELHVGCGWKRGNEGTSELVFHVIAGASPTVACQDCFLDARLRHWKKFLSCRGLHFSASSSLGIDCDPAPPPRSPSRHLPHLSLRRPHPRSTVDPTSTPTLRWTRTQPCRSSRGAARGRHRRENMSASSLRLARAIPPSLPLRNRLLTRPPPHFLPTLCCGATPFHRTPVLLQSEFGHSVHKKFGSRKLGPFERSPPRKQWGVQRKNDSGGPFFKTLDLRGDGKTGLEDEGPSADGEEPTVVDWGVLGEEPKEDWRAVPRKAPEKQHDPAKTEMRVRDQGLFTKELEHLLTKCE